MPFRTFFRINVRGHGFGYYWELPDNDDRDEIEKAVDWCLSRASKREHLLVWYTLVNHRLLLFARTMASGVGDEFGRDGLPMIVGCVVEDAADALGVAAASLKCARWPAITANNAQFFQSLATVTRGVSIAGELFDVIDAQLNEAVENELLVFVPPATEVTDLNRDEEPTRTSGPAPTSDSVELSEVTVQPSVGAATTIVMWLALVLAIIALGGVLILMLR